MVIWNSTEFQVFFRDLECVTCLSPWCSCCSALPITAKRRYKICFMTWCKQNQNHLKKDVTAWLMVMVIWQEARAVGVQVAWCNCDQFWKALYFFYVFHVISYRQRKRAFQRLRDRRLFKRSPLPIKAYSFPASLDRFICSKLELKQRYSDIF